jgi:hypothetical protein
MALNTIEETVSSVDSKTPARILDRQQAKKRASPSDTSRDLQNGKNQKKKKKLKTVMFVRHDHRLLPRPSKKEKRAPARERQTGRECGSAPEGREEEKKSFV